MNPRFHIAPSKEQAASAAAEFAVDRLAQALKEREKATLAVSGGSTPRLMFEHLAAGRFDWRRVHIFWVDERCVPPDHADSNYRMVGQALLEPTGIEASQAHRIEGELQPEEAASRYGAAISEFFQLEEGGLPRFDVVHLGMGADGHTASLFPGSPLIHEQAGIAAAAYAASRDSHRVTLLPRPILAARNIFFLVAGADKAATLRRVLAGPANPADLPAQRIAREREDIEWFVDQTAASEMK